MRADLLALTADDLATLTNRGTVKRAAREAGDVEVREETDGTVVVEADDASVVLPAGVPLEDARCTCAAVGLCRHIVRAVLAYAATGAAEPVAVESWNPGDVTDEALAGALRGPALRRGLLLVGRGVTATLVRSAKPMALLHDVEATVRFLVPHDLAYARCDCADPPPCSHVAVAVHAFRALDPALESGVVELPPTTPAAPPDQPSPGAPPPAAASSPPAAASSPPAGASLPPAGASLPPSAASLPHSAASLPPAGASLPPAGASSPPAARSSPPCAAPASLGHVDASLLLLAEAGLAGGGTAVAASLRRAWQAAREDGLPWPADVCAELADLVERHAAGDAAFDPVRVAQLVGEAVLRGDALRARSAPALFVGGPRSSTAETEVGGGRLVGLGTRVRHVGRLVDVDALVYDTTAHRVLAIGRAFGDPDEAPPRAFADLAATSLQRSISIASVGAGQLIATGGRRSPGGRLKLGRRPAALSAQRFEWGELLSAPTLVEGVAEARSVRSAAAPPPLGPRTAGANLIVVPLATLDAAGFHAATQSVVAQVRDPLGAELTIAHPFAQRAAGGAERLLAALDSGAKPLYVSGSLRLRGPETVITPIAVVFERPDGARFVVQPAVDRGDPAAAVSIGSDVVETPPGEPAVQQHLHEVQTALGELLVTGIERADRTVRDAWAALADVSDGRGSVLLAAQVRLIADALAARAHDSTWTPVAAAAATLPLAAALELAHAL